MRSNQMRLFWVWVAAALIGLLLAFHFFVVGKYSAYPWWHENDNDSDPTYAAQTVALINGSSLGYVHHPGASIYAIHGLIYRIAAGQVTSYRPLNNLNHVHTIDQTADILEMATRISRIASLLTAMVAVFAIILLIWQYTHNAAIAILWTFYIAMTPAFVQHSFKVRPELVSVLFFIFSLLIGRKSIEFCRGKLSALTWAIIFFGFMLGLAVFSKIQIGPAMALAIGIHGFIFYHRKDIFDASRVLKLAFFLAFVNACITPWWALVRPAFLTPEYLHSLYYLSDDLRVYGKAPANFIGLFLGVQLILFLVLILFREKRWAKIQKLVLYVQAILIGGWFSVYMVLIPASVHWSQYLQNTNHLLYAVLTNVTQGGFLINKHLGSQTLQEIARLHQYQTPLLHISILWFVGFAFILSIVRLLVSSRFKSQYGLALLFLSTGFLMDVVSSLRWTELMAYYLIYSGVAYAVGLAIWTSAEWQQAKAGHRWSYGYIGLIVGVLIINAISTSSRMLMEKPTDIKRMNDNDTPQKQWDTTHSHAGIFWRMAQASIEHHGP